MEFASFKYRWKLFILILAVIIGLLSLIVTNFLASELSNEERKKIELWAEGIRQLSNLESSNQDYTFIFQVVQNNTTVPVILTDESGNIISFRNLSYSKIDTPEKAAKVLMKMNNFHEPIVVNLLDGKKNFVYYKDSTTLIYLTYYPYIQLTVIILFLAISYYAFSQSRRAEQNRIWVGLAKETAHQLGTPTSSLLACLVMLREKGNPAAIAEELEKDILRLQKIVDRFSKIGSTPVLEIRNIVETINRSIDYLKTRSSKKISIVTNFDANEPILVPLNETLFEWVIENLFRNAVDAIQGNGEIKFSVTDNIQVVYIDISDNGRGLPKAKFKQVFQPGYTTKSRGWGLGLTLTKRIVEEYHKGRIFINYSELNKGTSFRIVLPKTA